MRSLSPEFANAKINEFLGPQPSSTSGVEPSDGVSDEITACVAVLTAADDGRVRLKPVG